MKHVNKIGDEIISQIRKSYPDEERELPADPYAELRNDPDLPPEVLAEMIAADDEYIAAYRKALREHFGLPPDDNT